ncbi:MULTISPECIES: hypothetical protein [Thermodesulfovibrio]|jgi:hypothetical protein|uniref:hypothetical protein n=1 Tax=Thermodesulfovibrio TaxID=28261 RepID=UPI0026287F4E|nr:hypothetical protein [Thermodesulfovibrio sp.]
MSLKAFITVILVIIIGFFHYSFSEQKPLQKSSESTIKNPSSSKPEEQKPVTKPSSSQVQRQEGTKTEFYDLEISDIYLDKDNKIWIVLRLLQGSISQSDYGKIKVSFNIPSLGSSPEIELNRIDPARELNIRKRKEINTNLILKKEETVICELKNITDKNSQNNLLKKKLMPQFSSSQMIMKESKLPQESRPELKSETKIEETQKRIPSTSSGKMVPLSTQLPEVLNILWCPGLGAQSSPVYNELSLEYDINSDSYGLSLEWNIFAIEDFKQINIKIVYVDDAGRERRIDEFSRGLNQPPIYFVSYRQIFDYLKRNRIITKVEPWKTYKFKVTGTVTIEKPSSQGGTGTRATIASGTQTATQQVTGPQGGSPTRRVIPTNSFDVYWFVKPEENRTVQPPASRYQQLQAGIYITPEATANSEGKFKMESFGSHISIAAGKKRQHWDESCSLGIYFSNFYLVIEDANNFDTKCSVSFIGFYHRFSPFSLAGQSLIIGTADNTGSIGYSRDGVSANFSLLNDFLNNRSCRNIFPQPEGKTFRIWAYADAKVYFEKPGKRCLICPETGCQYKGDKVTENYFVYSEPKYITLYKPEDIPPASRTPAEQDLTGFKPQTLQLNHPISTINITQTQGQVSEVISQVQGARIGIGKPLSVSWRDGIPAQTLIYFVIEKFTNNGWQEVEKIEHTIAEGESSFSLIPRTNASSLGGFSKGTYRLCHYYVYNRAVPFASQRSDWVYFQSVPPAQRVNLKLSELRTTPSRNHRSLSFRIKNISPYDLTTEYAQYVLVKVQYSNSNSAAYYRIPTPIPGIPVSGEASSLAGMGILVELPESFDLPENAYTIVVLTIEDTEAWTGDTITRDFVTY